MNGNAALEKVVMTPHRHGNVITIQVERVKTVNSADVYYEASGQHSGLIVNKDSGSQENGHTNLPPEMQLEFTCVMFNKKTGATNAENRKLKFWFVEGVQHLHRLDSSYEFFKELVNPETFPRDYAGFITKVMKQLQAGCYQRLRRVDIDMITLDKRQQEALVPDLTKPAEKDERPVEILIRENLQQRLEEAYPNLVSMDDLVRILKVDQSTLLLQLEELMDRGIIEKCNLDSQMDGKIGFRRKILHHNQEVKEVKGVNHFQQVSNEEKPTIAIITTLLCEKLAVDAMMENKTTFVRLKTEGESHVYTIGWIGPHKVISTKLPMVGRELQAKIASGGTTTRLLGAFQDIQHVFLVGVGGSVPHVYEFEKHSRLGDVVVSAPPGDLEEESNQSMYVFCERVDEPAEDAPPDTPYKFVLKKYTAKDYSLLKCVERVLDRYESAPEACEWLANIEESLRSLEVHNLGFDRPPPDTDKLKFKIGEGCTFDIKHPTIPEELKHLYQDGVPAVRLGSIGSGRPITDNDVLRDTFGKEQQLLAYDAEYDQVLESIIGNRLNSFIFIRGVADYIDGSKGTQWQPYASLSAAAFMKSVILEISRS